MEAASARGALAAISSASSERHASALPGSASRLTRCTSAASVAGHMRPVRTSSIARWYGIRLRQAQQPAGRRGQAALDLGQAELRAVEATTRSQASTISKPPARA